MFLLMYRCVVLCLLRVLTCFSPLLCQANGHLAVAKVLRGRLGFVQGQALRAQLVREKSGGGVSPAAAAADDSGAALR